MARPQTRHAERVVQLFRDSLSKTGRQAVGEHHFEELTLMIESALDAAVLEEVAVYAAQLERLVDDMKHSTDRYDIDQESAEQGPWPAS